MNENVSNKSVKRVPGGYGLPVFGWLKDTVDFFLISGWKEYFLRRGKKYDSSVFKSHMLIKTIALLDVKAFAPLFNWDGRLSKEYGFGWAKPPPALVGGAIPSIFANGAAHSDPKRFYLKLLEARRSDLAPAFNTASAEFLARWERGAPFGWRDEIERFCATFFFQWLVGVRPDPDDVRLIFNHLFSHIAWRVTRFVPWSKYSRALRAYARLRFMLKGLPGFEAACKIARSCGMHDEDEIVKQLLFTIGVNCYLGLQNLSKSVAGELSLRPSLQCELRAEALRELGASGTMDITKVLALPQLDVFIKETLRLHPPVFFIFGRSQTAFDLPTSTGTYRIDKGAMLMGVIPIAQRDPAVYDNPDEFQPKRFDNPDAQNAMVWAHGLPADPISTESRICAGRDLGVLLGKLFCVTLVRNHEWTLRHPEVRWNERLFTLNVAAPIGPLEVSRFSKFN